MQAQQEETQMVYDKYGVSPMGSCLQMLIQMPILFALLPCILERTGLHYQCKGLLPML